MRNAPQSTWHINLADERNSVDEKPESHDVTDLRVSDGHKTPVFCTFLEAKITISACPLI